MKIHPSTSIALVVVTGAAATAALPSCFDEGSGADYGEIAAPVEQSCARCHSASGIEDVLAGIDTLDDGVFSEESFPDAHFPTGLRDKAVADLIATADPAADASFEPAMPQRKAWLLHELHELAVLLEEAVPPDYTSQEKFDAFVQAGSAGAYEGCEMGAKLDLGQQGDPEGMAPLWAKKVFELLELDYTELAPADRQKIRDYVNATLPGGLSACVPGEDSAS